MCGTLVPRECQEMSSKQASSQARTNVLQGVHPIGGHSSHWDYDLLNSKSQFNNQALPIEEALLN